MDKTTLVRVLEKHKAWLKNMGGNGQTSARQTCEEQICAG